MAHLQSQIDALSGMRQDVLYLLKNDAVRLSAEILQFALRKQPKFDGYPPSSQVFQKSTIGRPIVFKLNSHIKNFGKRADKLIDSRNGAVHFEDKESLIKSVNNLVARISKYNDIEFDEEDDADFLTAVEVLCCIDEFTEFFL